LRAIVCAAFATVASFGPSERPFVAAQSFVDATASAGLTHGTTLPNCPTCAPTFAQEQSGGAAAGDFDGDGWTDLVFTRYWDSMVLYRNNHDGTFADVSASSLPSGLNGVQTNGVAWGDLDNDGFVDLVASTIEGSRHLLLINDGAGHFSEEGASRGLTSPGGLPTTAGTSVALGDYDRDGYLDMYVAEWRGFQTSSNPSQARLYRNLGATNPGHFVDVTAAAGVALDVTTGTQANKALSFTPKMADLDGDGLVDLAVVSDAKTSRVFWNKGDGTFFDGTAAAGVRNGTNDMGFALADFNGDGRLDWFATSIHNADIVPLQTGNRLYLNNGNRTFADVTEAVGVKAGGWGWGAEDLDADNDGLVDLIHTNGMGVAPVDQSVLFRNTGTPTSPHFLNASNAAGVTDAGLGRGALTFDYDRDGRQDALIVNLGSPPVLYRNVTANSNAWLDVRAIGVESNRDGYGVIVKVTPDASHPELAQTGFIDGSGGYLSQSEAVAHFGLGADASVDRLDVLWPSGYSQTFLNVAANRRVVVAEGLLADFNFDGIVADGDLSIWKTGYGSPGVAMQGDADRNGQVDGQDLLKWQRTLGRTASGGISSSVSTAFVPEPTGTFALIVGAALRMTARRRRASHFAAP
jgi:hypothetical protein